MAISATKFLQLSRNIRRIHCRAMTPLAVRSGLTVIEADVLLFLANNPGFDTARDMTELRGIAKSQVSPAVEHLCAAGLLCRTPDRADRRVVHLSITNQSRPLAEEMQAVQQTYMRKLTAGLSETELRAYESLMDKLFDNAGNIMRMEQIV